MEEKEKNENNINNEKTTLLNDININNDKIKEKNKQYDNLFKADEERQKKLFYQQRHLFHHKKDKKDPLINIYSKPLQEEYINEVNYITRNSILTIIISLIVLFHDFLIIRNFRTYNENILSLIFSSFTFFHAILLLIELFRHALLDQIRFKLYKFFSLLLSAFLLCFFVFQSSNAFVIYNKKKRKKEKCEEKKVGCGNDLIFNTILILNCLYIIGSLLLIKFQIWTGYNSIRVLLGCELEVVQKQILEDQKGKKEKEEKEDLNNENKVHKKQD